jgi:hypothetical protein
VIVSIETAWAALRGPALTTLDDLIDMVHDLKNSGESDVTDPLKCVVMHSALCCPCLLLVFNVSRCSCGMG